jgi:hypothetical protein
VPRGGRRVGAGRKKGTPNKRRRTVVEAHAEVAILAAAKPDTVTPLSHMMAVLNDPGSPPSRKDAAAAAAAPYMHPKLNLSATSELNGGGRIDNITIISVPRGAQYCPDTGLIRYEDGLEVSPPEFVPLEPTPGFDELPPAQPPVPEPSTPPPVEAVDVLDNPKLTRLDRWRDRKRAEDDPP